MPPTIDVPLPPAAPPGEATLRDMLASSAVSGMLAGQLRDENNDAIPLLVLGDRGLVWNAANTPERLARLAYAVADEMLRERSRR